ncbi:MAG: chitobiase/beta-hexosaminidase C-terminal domain-containing protein [Kiritimatiellia bacterium]
MARSDAATVYLGAPWRMPTATEFDDLIAKCTITWTTRNGVKGRLVTGKGDFASRSIFLPAAGNGYKTGLNVSGSRGYYWSSQSADNWGQARSLYFTSGEFTRKDLDRYDGQSIRALRASSQSSAACPATHLALDCRKGVRIADGTEHIYFSPEWEAASDGAIVTVSLDGVTVTNAAEAGTFEWTPLRDGTYVFTHVVTNGGEQVGETLRATFTVDGINPKAPVISPTSGRTFDTSLTVSMSCPTEGATIHYTTNGTMPTLESPVYARRFKVHEKATVKAVAFNENGVESELAEAEYALGKCAAPIISPADGTVFTHTGQVVSIARIDSEGLLRYTRDGSDPSPVSPIYTKPFTVDESTVVKAKVFSERYFDSQVVTAKLTRNLKPVACATPIIRAAETFTGSATRVEISCATSVAVIRYTTDGSVPDSFATAYMGPFWVHEGCTVKAVATCADCRPSSVASFAITKQWCIGDAMGVPDHTFETSGDVAFFRVDYKTAPGGEAMRSGAIADSAEEGAYNQSVLSTTVQGPGTLTFAWRSSCEADVDDEYKWDHAECAVDGEVVAWIDGITDWETVSLDIKGVGTHTVTWTYLKDDVCMEGEDCVWVAGFAWVSDEPYTHESAVAVPYAWIRAQLPHTVDEYAAYEAAVREIAANPVYTVMDCYVAGLDPKDPESWLLANILMDADGKPVVTWEPVLGRAEAAKRVYTVYGKERLDDAAWVPVTEANKARMRFFKVSVRMR